MIEDIYYEIIVKFIHICTRIRVLERIASKKLYSNVLVETIVYFM